MPLKLLRQVYALFGRYDNKTFALYIQYFFWFFACHATYLGYDMLLCTFFCCFWPGPNTLIYIYDGMRSFIVKYTRTRTRTWTLYLKHNEKF